MIVKLSKLKLCFHSLEFQAATYCVNLTSLLVFKFLLKFFFLYNETPAKAFTPPAEKKIGTNVMLGSRKKPSATPL